MLKIRRSRDRLIFNMGIPIPGKDSLYIEMGPVYCHEDGVFIVSSKYDLCSILAIGAL